MNERDIVRDFITRNFLSGEEGRLHDDTSFAKSRIIDSADMFRLVSFLEESFGIRVEDDELVPENLDSVLNIERFLRGKLTVHSSWEGVAKYPQL